MQIESISTGKGWSPLAGGRCLAGAAAREGGEVEAAPRDGRALRVRAGRWCHSFPALDCARWLS